jgi:hypothetical protein
MKRDTVICQRNISIVQTHKSQIGLNFIGRTRGKYNVISFSPTGVAWSCVLHKNEMRGVPNCMVWTSETFFVRVWMKAELFTYSKS